MFDLFRPGARHVVGAVHRGRCGALSSRRPREGRTRSPRPEVVGRSSCRQPRFVDVDATGGHGTTTPKE